MDSGDINNSVDWEEILNSIENETRDIIDDKPETVHYHTVCTTFMQCRNCGFSEVVRGYKHGGYDRICPQCAEKAYEAHKSSIDFIPDD